MFDVWLKNRVPKNQSTSGCFSFALFPQGPEFDEEEESDLTVTELRERARKQKAELEKKMMGDYSDEEEGEEKEGEDSKDHKKVSNDDSGCTWGMGELLHCALLAGCLCQTSL